MKKITYYLLNSIYSKVWDKKIVSSDELLKRYEVDYAYPKIRIYENPSCCKELYVDKYYNETDVRCSFECIGLIEKYSENIFDLIEAGDLIRHQWWNPALEKRINDISLVNDPNFEWLGKTYIHILGKDIEKDEYNLLEIYKPNEEGDYIKLWVNEKYKNSKEKKKYVNNI